MVVRGTGFEPVNPLESGLEPDAFDRASLPSYPPGNVPGIITYWGAGI